MDSCRRTRHPAGPSPGDMAPQTPVWVTHTPPPPRSPSLAHSPSPTPGTDSTAPPMVVEEEEGGSAGRRFPPNLLPHPRSWGPLLLQRWRRGRADGSPSSLSSLASSPSPLPLPHAASSSDGRGSSSPPLSPLLERGTWGKGRGEKGEGEGGGSCSGSSRGSRKPLLSNGYGGGGRLPYGDSPRHWGRGEGEEGEQKQEGAPARPAQLYAQKLEAYRLRYAHLAAWPGLLRLLAGLELLLGGAVVACVLPYLHRDREWAQALEGAYGGGGLGLAPPGYSYRGPATALVLAVVGVSWLLTLALLLVGVTVHYRAVLLPAPWWPPAEALLSLALFALHMVAGATRLQDLSRGGLCGGGPGLGGPLLAALCRTEGGQVAGTAFLFLNALLYLGGFLVGLAMWRQQAARRQRALWRHPVATQEEERVSSATLTPTKQKHVVFEDNMDQEAINKHSHFTEDCEQPVIQSKATPTDICKLHIIADYIMKYPEIHSVEEREQYKAVFNDQYQEYKDLHRDICATLRKFNELDAMMAKLHKQGSNYKETKRIQSIMKNFEVKKNDPAFHERKERCSYLKAKLSHIKKRIYIFDQETAGKS